MSTNEIQQCLKEHNNSFHYYFFYVDFAVLSISFILMSAPLTSDDIQEEFENRQSAILGMNGIFIFLGILTACYQFK